MPAEGDHPTIRQTLSPAPPGELRIHLLAVGHADAIVLELPSGRLAVVDFGHPLLLEHLARLDPDHKRRYAFCLVTHTHHDHTACLETFLQHYDRQVEEYWFSFADPGDRIPLLALRAATIRGRRGRLLIDDAMTPLPLRQLEPGVEVVPFAPPTSAVLRPPGAGGSSAENNRSIVLLIQYGSAVILLGADAEVDRWHQIAWQAQTSGISIGADLIKPSHHGAAPPHGIPENLWPQLLRSPDSVAVFSIGRVRDLPHLRTIATVRARATVRCTGRALTCRPLPGPLPMPAGAIAAGEEQTNLFAQALLPAPESTRGPLCFGTQTYRVSEGGGVTLLRARQPAFLDACIPESDPPEQHVIPQQP